MNFTIANMIGAIDKKFEQKYNYLISLLSKKITDMEYIPPFTDVTYLSTWDTYNSDVYHVGYRLVGKTVYLRGIVAGGIGAIFTLPSNMRPTKTVFLSAVNYGATLTYITIFDSGNVTPAEPVATFLALDGLSFQLD